MRKKTSPAETPGLWLFEIGFPIEFYGSPQNLMSAAASNSSGTVFVLPAADAADFGCGDLRGQASGGSAAVTDAGAVARAETAGALCVYKDLSAGAAVADEQRAVQNGKHRCAYGHGITSDYGLTASLCGRNPRGVLRQKKPRPACRTGLLPYGADDGSRTHLCSLGSCRSTDELHPQRTVYILLFMRQFVKGKLNVNRLNKYS